VLWKMLFSMGLKIDGYVGAITTWALFAAWAGFTIAILVTMEGLSAFLHTLRLHW
jgi:V-type H+-transporting ATPase subunit a